MLVRILIISQYFFPEIFRVNQLATALQDRNHEVVILTGQPNYPTGRFFAGHSFFGPCTENWHGIKVLRVPVIPRLKGKWWHLAMNYISFAVFATLFGLPRLRGRFDACIAFCPSPITSAIPAIIRRFFWRTPAAIWLQDLWPESPIAVTKSKSRLFKAALNLLVRLIHRNADQIWIQSPAYRKSVESTGAIAERIAYVPNWAEDLYDCDRWTDMAGESIPPNSVVFAGNLGHAQGLETVVEAATITRDTAPSAHWIFVGDGALRDWLKQEISRRNLIGHVTLLDRRAPEDMPTILKSSAATLVSLGSENVFAQTIPSKIPSCLASGRPVIGMVSGASARLLDDARCGFVCEPGDAVGLAGAVSSLVSLTQQERSALGQNGHAYYRQYFMQTHVVQQIEELLERLPSWRK